MDQSKIDISRFSYLWTSELSDHALLAMGETRNGVREFLVVNTRHKTALIIENDDTAVAVKEEMLKHGCRIIGVDEFV